MHANVAVGTVIIKNYIGLALQNHLCHLTGIIKTNLRFSAG